jgi:hypothetical protein
LVCVLAGGDYLLWNWSLQGSHDVLALVSGLTLPPLAIALVWLLALNAARLLTRLARPSARREPARHRHQSTRASRQPMQQRQQPGEEQERSSSSRLAA